MLMYLPSPLYLLAIKAVADRRVEITIPRIAWPLVGLVVIGLIQSIAFTGSDVYGRFKRLQGYDVFEPIGFDAFGIHSENYAIKVGINPGELIPRNIENFRRQLRSIGGMFDWRHEHSTTDPRFSRESWNVGISLVWTPCGRNNICTNYSRPLFNVADNGTFITRFK